MNQIHQQVRAMQAQQAAASAAAAREAVMQAATRFAIAHPDVVTWLMDNAGNEFADSLSRRLNDTGSLTENMIAAVRKGLARAAAPAAQGVEINVGRIEEAFASAQASGLKKLRMHLDSFKFSPAGANSANAGGIYVKRSGGDGAYLGKVMGGKFLRSRDCTDDEEKRIVEAASDPEKAAKAYGQRTGQCSICGRELTAEESIERFVGPVCAERYGF
jgi:hypothetical protein